MDPTMTFESLLRDGGSVGAVLAVVLFFLRHLRARDVDAKDSRELFTEEMKSIASDCHERHREAQTGYQASLQRLVDSNERQFERTDQRLQRVEDGVATLLERTTVKDAS